jgi:hypothetical protein
MSRTESQRLSEAGHDGPAKAPPTRNPTHRFIKETIMNRKNLLSALAAASFAVVGASSAVAQEAGSDAWMQAASTQTRAQVQVDLAQARADGSIKAVGAGYLPSVKVSQPRADVRAALEQARASGELAALNSEVYEYVRPVPVRLARVDR